MRQTSSSILENAFSSRLSQQPNWAKADIMLAVDAFKVFHHVFFHFPQNEEVISAPESAWSPGRASQRLCPNEW